MTYLLFLCDFDQNRHVSTNFNNYPQTPNFTKICPVTVAPFHAEGMIWRG